MDTIALHTNSYDKIYDLLNEQLEGSLSNDLGEKLITLNNTKAQGTVRGMKIRENKIFIEFDFFCLKDLEIHLPSLDYNPIHFLYCQSDDVVQSYEFSEEKNVISEFQTAIIFNKNQSTTLKFTKGQVKVTLISVCLPEQASQPSQIVSNIHSLFESKLKDNSFLYIGSHNLKIVEQISKLDEIKEVGIVRKLFIEGIVQLILAMEIQHHQDDLNIQTSSHGSLSKRELKIIQELGMEIKENADRQYNIKDLTFKSGIPAAKLQEGFKHLFGRTVTDYIKNVRIEIAEELIKTTDLTISEIVYTIGFTSRSYFSKIFKEKYKCSPRSYQESQKYIAVSA